jgi:type VI protein secretion system component Hcp
MNIKFSQMKIAKIISLIFLLGCTTTVFGQVYQLPNGNFENWSGSETSEPAGWHSFPSAKCDLSGLAAFGCGSVTNSNQLDRVTDDRPGHTGNVVKLKTQSILSVIANGNLTTGRIRVSSTTADNTGNHNRTNTDTYNQIFTSKPDSIVFWAKFVCPSASQEFRMNAIIHEGGDEVNSAIYTDPNQGNATYIAREVAIATLEQPRISETGEWKRYSAPFDYSHQGNNPAYILITFSTNKVPGQGSTSDQLYIDDIEMIYNTRLASLSVNGTALAGFNPDVTDYTYISCAGQPLPSVSGVKQSPNANNPVVVQASDENPTATVTVTHGDQTRTYSIHFNVLQAPTLASDTFSVCNGNYVTLTATPPTGENISCNWYATSGAVSPVPDGSNTNSISVNPTANRSYYVCTVTGNCESERIPVFVTVNPKPSVPIVNNRSFCVAGEYEFSAIAGTNGNTVNWYDAATAGNLLNQGPTYTAQISQNIQYYLSTLNTETACESASRANLSITLHPAVSVPAISGSTAFCGSSGISLSVVAGTNGDQCRWYVNESDEVPVHTGNNYSPSITSTTTYYVSTRSTTTGCESNKIPYTVVINAIPQPPVPQNAERCGEGTVTLSASAVGTNIVCRWYDASNGTTHLNTGSNFTTPSLNATTNYYVDAYNTETQCMSSRAEVKAFVYPQYFYSETFNVCDSFVWKGSTYKQSGTYLKHYTTIHNCDSNYTLHLTVRNSASSSFTVINCGSYVWSGTTYTQSGTYQKTFTAANGCDSVVSLYLTIHPVLGAPQLTTSEYNFCEGDNISVFATPGTNGNQCKWFTQATGGEAVFTGNTFSPNINSSQTYYVATAHSNTPCESERRAVQISIHPKPAVPITSDAARCGNGSITLQASSSEANTVCRWFLNNTAMNPLATGNSYSFDLNTTGEQSRYVSAMNTTTSCESQRVQVKAINNAIPAAPQIVAQAVCKGNNVNLNPSGGNTFTHYQWFANATSNTVLSTSNSFFINNIDRDTILYVNIINNTTGCESNRIPATVSVKPTYSSQFTVEICGSSYTWNSEIFTTSGNYTRTLTAKNACDSVVTLHLILHSVYHLTLPTVSACQSYTWNNQTYTQNGNYTQNFTSVNGCDSIVTLPLIIYPTYHKNIEASICEGASYVFFGKTLNESGIYDTTLQTIHGCDSIVSLTLSVTDNYYTNLHASICEGETYSFFGKTLNESGIYDTTLQTIHGCDSIVSLTLSLIDNYHTNLHASICEGASYVFFGKTLNEGGIYDTTLQAIHGCDSIISLTLSIIDKYYTTLHANICEGETYSFFGQNLNASGTYKDSLQATSGCDSVVTLHLTVHYNADTTFLTAAICEGETYNANGFNLTPTAAGLTTNYLSLTTINGCDSIVVLNLTVNADADTTFITAAICEGETYNENGFNLTPTAAGLTTNHLSLTTINGCDSIVVLNLTVNANADTTFITAVICEGENYIDNGFNIINPSVGLSIHHLSLSTTNGCDSVVQLILTVKPAAIGDTTVTACNSFTWYGIEYTSNATPTHTFTAANGCDSIVTLNLTINYNADTTFLIAAICEGEDYTENGFNIIQPLTGLIINHLSLNTIHGCDSVVSLNLTVNSTYESYDTLIVCNNEISFPVTSPHNPSEMLYNSISKDYIFSTENGCDSIIHFAFIVNNAYQGYDVVERCADNSVLYYGDSIFTESGVYNVIFERSNGCDSIITLTYVIYPIMNYELEITSCESYTYGAGSAEGEQNYTVSGTYTHTFSTVHGCDSVVTLHLTVHYNADTTFLTAAICEGETYNANGFNLTPTAAGLTTNHLSLTTINGCDSIITLNLTVNANADTTFITAAICEGETYNANGFNLSPTAVGLTTNHLSLTTINGCDSIVVLNLTVNANADTTFITAAICEGETYNENGFNLTPTAAGLTTNHLSLNTITGCDSIVVLNLTVNQPDEVWYYDTICQGDSYFNHGFNLGVMNNFGTFEDEHYGQNIHGCDSTTYLFLTVKASPKTYLTEVACDQYVWNDSIYTQSGIYQQTFIAANGCDSIVLLTLNINYSYSQVYYDTLCQGNIYSNYGFELPEQTFTGDTTYKLRFFTTQHCDSLLTLHLHVFPSYFIKITDTIHEGESYHKYGFDIENPAVGLIRDTLYLSTANGYGCDSTIALLLFIFLDVPAYQDVANVLLYPNPVTNQLRIKNYELRNGDILRIFDIFGRVVERRNDVSPQNSEITIDISHLPAGVYVLQIGNYRGKFVKQ